MKQTPKKYNEFRVVIRWENNKPTIENKYPTRRGLVSIHEHEAELMNRNYLSTKLIYELAEEVKSENKSENDELRKQLFEEAKSLGLNVAKNISTEKLQEKINEFKKTVTHD